MVARDHEHRDPRIVQTGESVERRRVSAGLRFDLVKEVARVDEHVRAHGDDPVNGGKEVVVDELFAQVHHGLRINPIKSRQSEMHVCQMNELHAQLISVFPGY